MRRLLALSCAIVLVETIFYGTLTPLVPYFSEEFALSKSAVGILSGAFGAGVLVLGTALFSRGTEKVGVEGVVAFGVTNFACASGYAVGAPLGGALADLRGDALSYLFLMAVCELSLLLLRKTV